METRILNDVAVHGALIMSKNETGFPENPRVGTILVKDNALYAYIQLGDLETWYPFGSKTNSYIHVQGLASTTWTVEHNLNSGDLWYQVQDNNGEIINAKVTVVDQNTITVTLTTPITGKVVVVAPNSIDVPVVKASSINVGNGYVVVDNSGVRVDGDYVLTEGNIEFYAEQAVAAEATARANADTTLQSNINAEVTARAAADTTLQNAIDGKQPLLTHAEVSSAVLITESTAENQVVDMVVASQIRSVKYHVQAVSGASYHTTEISIVHDGSTAYMTEYGTIVTQSSLATFNADVSGGNLRLLVTPANAETTIKVVRIAIKV